MSLRRSEAAVGSRQVVKSRSYQSQGEGCDHGDDDEAWELSERSVRGWRRQFVGVEKNKGKGVLDRRPAQLGTGGRRSRRFSPGATPIQIGAGCASSSSDIETLLLL
jgi:hypothetical protein